MSRRSAPTPNPQAYAGYNALVSLGLLPAGLNNVVMSRRDHYIYQIPEGASREDNTGLGFPSNALTQLGNASRIANTTTIRGVDATGIYHHILISRSTPIPGQQMPYYRLAYLRTTSDFSNVLESSYPQPENARITAAHVYSAIGSSIQTEEARKPILANRKPAFAPGT